MSIIFFDNTMNLRQDGDMTNNMPPKETVSVFDSEDLNRQLKTLAGDKVTKAIVQVRIMLEFRGLQAPSEEDKGLYPSLVTVMGRSMNGIWNAAIISLSVEHLRLLESILLKRMPLEDEE